MGIATKAILIGRHDVGQVITALSASGLIEKATIDYPRQGGYDTFSCVEPTGAALTIWVFGDAAKDDFNDVYDGDKTLVDMAFSRTSSAIAALLAQKFGGFVLDNDMSGQWRQVARAG